MRIFSGVQPTGRGLHLGNYLGALRRFGDIQASAPQSLFCIVDLHAMTVRYDPRTLRSAVRSTLAAYLAIGLDPSRSILFAQSSVREHAELAWILNCTARLGSLDRMTQFKDKAGPDAERESLGLYAYPVLMAADILLYRATHVPVGEDQRQHLELAREIAQRFNHAHGYDVFPKPFAMVGESAARVMSLQDPTRKMSKSDPSAIGRIDLTDDADTIARKVAKAVTDAGAMPESVEALADRAGVRNLVEILAALTRQDLDQTLAQMQGLRFSDLKRRLTDVLVAEIVPIGARIHELEGYPAHLEVMLDEGAERARAIAQATMDDVRIACGYR
jgi:tryptophanyl-tRNA synthetase